MIIRDIEKPADIILEARYILSERFKMFFNVENVSIIFLLVSYLIVGMRVTLSYR